MSAIDRGELYTLTQARVILGDRFEDFVAGVACGAVPSSLATTQDPHTAVVVSAGALWDWLHGDLPAATPPADTVDRFVGQVEAWEAVQSTLDRLDRDVRAWAADDRIDVNAASDVRAYVAAVRVAVDHLSATREGATR